MSILCRTSASFSPQGRDAEELTLTHQIRWVLLVPSQEHGINQNTFFKQKSSVRRKSRGKQCSGENWAWRLSKNIINLIRKANRDVWGREGKECRHWLTLALWGMSFCRHLDHSPPPLRVNHKTFLWCAEAGSGPAWQFKPWNVHVN